LANSIETLKTQVKIKEDVLRIAKEQLALVGDEQKKRALQFVIFSFDGQTKLVPEDVKQRIRSLEKKGVYEKNNYREDGKLIIVQVFDKEDSASFKDLFWNGTQTKFGKGSKHVAEGEVKYELANAQMFLYMGKDDEDNVNHIKKMLDEHPNMIITFRGHSYSLENNFPSDVFGNKKGNMIFIPGSCGSSGAIPTYIASNSNTNINFFSYTSTGIGTNTDSLVDGLINARNGVKFHDILEEKKLEIASNFNQAGVALKPDEAIKSISVWTGGESLLWFVLRK
ncbi:MAG: hypothetical protein PHS02_02935, partial [Candidatus ainarchaeum sp.]|nr:hypothetical protein [Candidatus ainarchaeum sp.]